MGLRPLPGAHRKEPPMTTTPITDPADVEVGADRITVEFPPDECLIHTLDAQGTTLRYVTPCGPDHADGAVDVRPMSSEVFCPPGEYLNYTAGPLAPWSCETTDPCLNGTTLWSVTPCAEPTAEVVAISTPGAPPVDMLPATGVEHVALGGVATLLIVLGIGLTRLRRTVGSES